VLAGARPWQPEAGGKRVIEDRLLERKRGAAALKKGLLGFIEESDADVICLQETKAHPGDVQHVKWPRGYEMFWNSAEKKGYSGTAVLTRVKPKNVWNGIGAAVHDTEGRVLAVEFEDFWLVNVYQPNSQRGLTRLEYRVEEVGPGLPEVPEEAPVEGEARLFCGDLNVAHTEIDLANPKTNRRNAGLHRRGAQSFGRLLDAGFVDTFREFEKGPGHYTWWSQMGDCRKPATSGGASTTSSPRRSSPRAQEGVDQPGGHGQRPLPRRASRSADPGAFIGWPWAGGRQDPGHEAHHKDLRGARRALGRPRAGRLRPSGPLPGRAHDRHRREAPPRSTRLSATSRPGGSGASGSRGTPT
jgi:exodeoxyribonuclease-3